MPQSTSRVPRSYNKALATERMLVDIGALGTEEERIRERQARLRRAQEDPRSQRTRSTSDTIAGQIIHGPDDDAPDRSDRTPRGVGIVQGRRSRPGGKYGPMYRQIVEAPMTKVEQAKLEIMALLETGDASATELKSACEGSDYAVSEAFKALRSEGKVRMYQGAATGPDGKRRGATMYGAIGVRPFADERRPADLPAPTKADTIKSLPKKEVEEPATETPDDAGDTEIPTARETLQSLPVVGLDSTEHRLKEALLAKIEDATPEQAIELARMIQELGG